MTPFAKFLTCVLPLATLAAPVVAAEPRQGNDPLAIQALHNFAACAADRTPQGAVKILAMDFRTPEYQQELRRYAKGHNYCASHSDIRFAGILFSGSLAEAMLVSHSGKEPLTARLVALKTSTFEARNESERFSMCVLQHQPELASTVFATEPTSKEETAALIAAGPALESCVAPDGRIRLNKPALRALLALAAYRMIHYPGATPAAGN